MQQEQTQSGASGLRFLDNNLVSVIKTAAEPSTDRSTGGK